MSNQELQGKRLGRFVKDQRLLIGLTQAELAFAAGVSRSSIRRMESGETGLSLTVFLKVLDIFGVTDLLVESINPHLTDRGLSNPDLLAKKRVRRQVNSHEKADRSLGAEGQWPN